MTIRLSFVKKTFALLLCLSLFLSVSAQWKWEQVKPGVWKGTYGTPESYSLLSVAGIKPLDEGLFKLP